MAIIAEGNRDRQASQRSRDSTWLNKSKNIDIMSNDPVAAEYNPPAPVACGYCGKPRYTKGFAIGGTIWWQPDGPEPCGCRESILATERELAEMDRRQRAAEIRQESGMGARFLRRTFDTFQETTENTRALRACKQYAETFRDKLPENNPDQGRNGLFITGPKGTGKTHLAAAIANHVMQEGIPAVCMTTIDLLDRIKNTFGGQGYGARLSEYDVMKSYKEIPLLIIDDVGKEPATEWAVSKLYTIVNARYEALRPIIITTNYSDGDLVKRLTPRDTGDHTTADATVDRLREMCAGIITTGESWRGR